MTSQLGVRGGHIQLFSRTVNTGVQWRLLSGNNRETGRGAGSFPDAELCWLAVKELQSAIDETTGAVRRIGVNEWGWQLSLGPELVACSSRGFDRMIRCEQGMEHFLAQLREARIGATLMMSHARRW